MPTHRKVAFAHGSQDVLAKTADGKTAYDLTKKLKSADKKKAAITEYLKPLTQDAAEKASFTRRSKADASFTRRQQRASKEAAKQAAKQAALEAERAAALERAAVAEAKAAKAEAAKAEAAKAKAAKAEAAKAEAAKVEGATADTSGSGDVADKQIVLIKPTDKKAKFGVKFKAAPDLGYGVVVTHIEEAGAAASSSLVVGDIIRLIDDVATDSPEEAVRSKPPPHTAHANHPLCIGRASALPTDTHVYALLGVVCTVLAAAKPGASINVVVLGTREPTVDKAEAANAAAASPAQKTERDSSVAAATVNHWSKLRKLQQATAVTAAFSANQPSDDGRPLSFASLISNAEQKSKFNPLKWLGGVADKLGLSESFGSHRKSQGESSFRSKKDKEGKEGTPSRDSFRKRATGLFSSSKTKDATLDLGSATEPKGSPLRPSAASPPKVSVLSLADPYDDPNLNA